MTFNRLLVHVHLVSVSEYVSREGNNRDNAVSEADTIDNSDKFAREIEEAHTNGHTVVARKLHL